MLWHIAPTSNVKSEVLNGPILQFPFSTSTALVESVVVHRSGPQALGSPSRGLLLLLLLPSSSFRVVAIPKTVIC